MLFSPSHCLASLAIIAHVSLAADCWDDTVPGTVAQYYSVAGNICNNGYWDYTQDTIQGTKSGATSDSYCWDAYNNIIEQCIENTPGSSGGSWSYDGQTYTIMSTSPIGE